MVDVVYLTKSLYVGNLILIVTVLEGGGTFKRWSLVEFINIFC
jgi:hypothetical protein